MTNSDPFTVDDFRNARVLADQLMASGNPSEHCEDLENLDQGIYLALDSICFECATCSLWFPVAKRSDIDGRFLCEDCK